MADSGAVVSPVDRDSGGPLVSIGLPVFNEELNVPQALDSLLAQSYHRLEVIVSDNASTDRTVEIARQYAAGDPRVTVVRNETNLGMAENFNRVVRLAHGEYFMWAAADDRWSPAFIARCLEVLEEAPSVVLAYPLTVRASDAAAPRGPVLRRLDTRGYDPVRRFVMTVAATISGSHVYGLFRADALRRTRLLRQVFGADKILLSELSWLGEFAQVPEPLFHRRAMRDDEGLVPRRRRYVWAMPIPARWIVFPRLQTLRGYLGVVWTAPLPFVRRVALGTVLVAAQVALHGRRLFQFHVVAGRARTEQRASR